MEVSMSSSSPSAVDLEGFIKDEMARLAETDTTLPFDRDEYAGRLRQLREAMSKEGIDVLVLTAPDTMCWLHGYSSRVYEWHCTTQLPPTRATVVHVDRDPMFYVDTAFHEALVRRTSCVDDFRPLPMTGLSSFASVEQFNRFLIGELGSEGWLGGVVGLERWSGVPNPAVTDLIEDAIRASGCKIVDATRSIRSVRRLKSPQEIALIERAQVACDAGLRLLQTEGKEGMTELDAWHIYMGGVIQAGGEPSAIHETVCVGPIEAYAHALSSRRVIHRGEYFHADMSAAVERYHARGTRPFCVGDPPVELTRLASIVAGAYDVLTETAKVNMPFRELNRALQSYFREEGIGDDAAFAGGYELGLSFAPDFVGEFLWGSHDIDTNAIIEDGLVTNFESVAPLTAIIDTVVFEETGARFLSDVPREVLVIGQ
jgi:Xaa-Pro aminopeptidase